MNLEEYEKIIEDHGHLDVYYPRSIIQETLRKNIIAELVENIVTTNSEEDIKEIVNKCIRGY